MLNKHGHGTLYFGVWPNGEAKGQIVNESTTRDVSRKIYESIVPQIIPTIKKLMLKENLLLKLNFKEVKNHIHVKACII